MLIGLLVAALVVLVVLSASAFEGWGPFATPAPTTTGIGPTFAGAATLAADAAARSGGGPWVVWAATGLDLPAAATVSTDLGGVIGPSSSVLANCTVAPEMGVGASLRLPGFTGNLSSGESPAWFLYLRNASGAGRVITVIGGSAQAFGAISGPGCPATLVLARGLEGVAVDSGVAVPSALFGGGYAFLRAHPSATLSMTAQGGLSTGNETWQPDWTIGLSACPLGAATGSAPTFTAIVALATGALEGTPSTALAPC